MTLFLDLGRNSAAFLINVYQSELIWCLKEYSVIVFWSWDPYDLDKFQLIGKVYPREKSPIYLYRTLGAN